jgi:DNA-binding MarR family transcriptional regulator
MQNTEIRDPEILIRTLADFRYEMRRFYQFSEKAALAAGVQPRQHQLLLQVAAAPEPAAVTVAYLAERLGLKHNSAVELVDRSESEGLVARTEDGSDRRRTILRVTRKGHQLLSKLASQHARELNEAAPRLMHALEHIRKHAHREAE